MLVGAKVKHLTIGKIQAENLAMRKGTNFFKLPNIDTVKLLWAIVVHEILDSAIRYDDANGAKSYLSENISPMKLVAGLENTDSLAYIRIAATFMEMGYGIDNDGYVKKKKRTDDT